DITDVVQRLTSMKTFLGVTIAASAGEPGQHARRRQPPGMAQIAAPALTPRRPHFGAARINQAFARGIGQAQRAFAAALLEDAPAALLAVGVIFLDAIAPPKRSEEHTSELQSREKLVCR